MDKDKKLSNWPRSSSYQNLSNPYENLDKKITQTNEQPTSAEIKRSPGTLGMADPNGELSPTGTIVSTGVTSSQNSAPNDVSIF